MSNRSWKISVDEPTEPQQSVYSEYYVLHSLLIETAAEYIIFIA